MAQVEKYSKGWRAFDIAIGVIMIIFSAIVLASPALSALTLTFYLSFGLLALGIGMIGIGAAVSRLPKWLRACDIGAGAIALLVIGIENIISGMRGNRLPRCYGPNIEIKR